MKIINFDGFLTVYIYVVIWEPFTCTRTHINYLLTISQGIFHSLGKEIR